MFSVFIPFVHFASAIVLLVMWRSDRKNRYLMWWGAAFLIVPGAVVFGRLAYLPPYDKSWFFIGGFAAAVAALVFTLLKGSLEFNAQQQHSFSPHLSAGLAFFFFLVVYALGSISMVHLYTTVAVGAAWVIMGVTIWSKGFWHRITALIFIVRAVATTLLAVLLIKAPSLHGLLQEHGNLYLSLTIVLSVLFLLLICFIRSQQELNEHLAVLSIAHEVTSKLQNNDSLRELGYRIIPPFITDHGWQDGLMSIVESDNTLRVVASWGHNLPENRQQYDPVIPVNGSISGYAVRARDVYIGGDVSKLDIDLPRTTGFYGYVPKTVAAIPLVSSGKIYGVIVLTTPLHRQVNAQERSLFATISNAVGLSIANASYVDELAQQATHDTLTGLGNRAAYHEHVARLGSAPLMVMLLDLNRFKEVNDTFGHLVGDQLLKQMAERLQRVLPEHSAAVFRLSGDEFSVVINLAQEKLPGAAGYPQQLAKVFDARFEIQDLSLKVTASIGVVEATTEELDSHEMLRCADVAMYQAKKSNGLIAVYNKDADNEVRARVQLLSSVEPALEQHQFEMYYQPQIDLRTGLCRGAESLIRWRHPQQGLLGAALFMPFIEATEQIQPITYEVLNLTLKELSQWQALGWRLPVSINLSARNLFDHQLPDYIHQQVQSYAIAPELIHFEITESALMTDPEMSRANLLRLAEQGFTIALDDFGTGYSSLAYLSKFPIDVLKIDQSFIGNIVNKRKNQAIVKATIDMSHDLNKCVIAEGIENQADADFVSGLGCDIGQGFHYAEPMSGRHFLAWLSRQGELSAAVKGE
ncbi:putative bifunctional diguanylate cyclase/phosphodiesterase [Halioxenophilus sp. WMMB6]|uniref:putative bifunctional diguanylate cyclase/phosphodiesterase n=1 Tax=Halioxenophilus sp. WMMB6 TaxID=3073815 RepID=UPI00295E4D6C|nr:EAL domain-containing protein [Halioxenophilus sp. WMMB6]